MSAAQPADPAHPHTSAVNGPDDAAVLPLKPRRGPRGILQPVRGRWSPMGDTEQSERHLHTAGNPEPRPDNDVTALDEFASTIETSFLEIGQSLTNPATEAVFQRTLDVWERTLQGHHAQGTIDGQQLDRLLETLNGMRRAPTLL